MLGDGRQQGFAVLEIMRRKGAEFPWITESNYFWDRKILLRAPVEDDTLDFSGPKPIELPPLQRAEPALQQAAE